MTRPESSGSGLFLSNASKLTLQLKFAACFKRDEGVFRESERHRGNRACSSTVEQGTHNPLVLGSNPGGPTKTFKANGLSRWPFLLHLSSIRKRRGPLAAGCARPMG